MSWSNELNCRDSLYNEFSYWGWGVSHDFHHDFLSFLHLQGDLSCSSLLREWRHYLWPRHFHVSFVSRVSMYISSEWNFHTLKCLSKHLKWKSDGDCSSTYFLMNNSIRGRVKLATRETKTVAWTWVFTRVYHPSVGEIPHMLYTCILSKKYKKPKKKIIKPKKNHHHHHCKYSDSFYLISLNFEKMYVYKPK